MYCKLIKDGEDPNFIGILLSYLHFHQSCGTIYIQSLGQVVIFLYITFCLRRFYQYSQKLILRNCRKSAIFVFSLILIIIK